MHGGNLTEFLWNGIVKQVCKRYVTEQENCKICDHPPGHDNIVRKLMLCTNSSIEFVLSFTSVRPRASSINVWKNSNIALIRKIVLVRFPTILILVRIDEFEIGFLEAIEANLLESILEHSRFKSSMSRRHESAGLTRLEV